MIYYLAFDTGPFRAKKSQYINIPLSKINPELSKKDNLKNLCAFTKNFNNSQELKNYIISLFPSLAKYKFYDLVIIWKEKKEEANYIHVNSVPYQKDYCYFDFDFLTKTIASNIYSPFFTHFFNHYRKFKDLRKELQDLNDKVNDYKPTYVIEEAVRIFLQKALYQKQTLNFSKLYNIAMYTSNLLSLIERENIASISSIPNVDEEKLPEAVILERKWLKNRFNCQK